MLIDTKYCFYDISRIRQVIYCFSLVSGSGIEASNSEADVWLIVVTATSLAIALIAVVVVVIMIM